MNLAAPGVEAPVGQERHGPVRKRPQLVAGPHDTLPGDCAAEPVRIDQLAQAGGAVDSGALEPEQPQRPGRGRAVERRPPPAAAEPRVHGQLPSARRHGQHPQHDDQVGPVVVEVRGGEEEVVGDDPERRRRRQSGEEADRHGDGARRGQPEQSDVHGLGQLRIPGDVGLVEGVPVGPPVQAVGEEGVQMQEHDRAGQHPQQREGAHADGAAEQVVEPVDQPAGTERRADRGRVHPAPPRTSLRSSSTRGGSSLCQDVTLASR